MVKKKRNTDVLNIKIQISVFSLRNKKRCLATRPTSLPDPPAGPEWQLALQGALLPPCSRLRSEHTTPNCLPASPLQCHLPFVIAGLPS